MGYCEEGLTCVYPNRRGYEGPGTCQPKPTPKGKYRRINLWLKWNKNQFLADSGIGGKEKVYEKNDFYDKIFAYMHNFVWEEQNFM